MQSLSSKWRLILHQPAEGPWNMAVDEAIFEAAGAGRVPPTLRLYAWEPACLSIGYAQPVEDVDTDALLSHGWQLVRRPTGGRAILHTDELTYSICGPASDRCLKGGVLESYQRISQALLSALHYLDVQAHASPKPDTPPGSKPKGPVCFEVPSNYEITHEGKKLVGSAQARRKNGVLQHGSLPLAGDITRITRVLRFPSLEERQTAADRLAARATTAEAALKHPITWKQASSAFVSAFSEILHIDFIDAELTPEERQRAKELLVEKYQNDKWTWRI